MSYAGEETVACRTPIFESAKPGVFQWLLTPMIKLLQKHCDTDGRGIVIQIGGAYTTFCQNEGILLQKYRDRNGRCITILFKGIRVRGRFDSSEKDPCLKPFWNWTGSVYPLLDIIIHHCPTYQLHLSPERHIRNQEAQSHPLSGPTLRPPLSRYRV